MINLSGWSINIIALIGAFHFAKGIYFLVRKNAAYSYSQHFANVDIEDIWRKKVGISFVISGTIIDILALFLETPILNNFFFIIISLPIIVIRYLYQQKLNKEYMTKYNS